MTLNSVRGSLQVSQKCQVVLVSYKPRVDVTYTDADTDLCRHRKGAVLTLTEGARYIQ